MFASKDKLQSVPVSLGKLLDAVAAAYRKKESILFDGTTYTYRELDEQASRVAGGLQELGVARGDRVALMLPNIPEFVFTFFGVQKLGAIAVPFNTMYKGREITHILQDSGAKVIVCLSNFANLINEVRYDCPALEHVVVTGQRTFVYVDPEATINVQMVVERSTFESADDAFHTVGGVLVDTFHALGVSDAWYKHQGAIRSNGKKLGVILMAEIENLYVVTIVTYLRQMNTDRLFRVLYVPPEIRDKALEPMTSVTSETGREVSYDQFRDQLVTSLQQRLGILIDTGELTRDERMAYEKNRALAGRI